MEVKISLFIFLVFGVFNVSNAQLQSHTVVFETSDGIYGSVQIKTKPHTMGYGYVIVDAQNMTINGVKGQSNPPGFNFPMTVSKFTINVSGEGCMYLNSSQPYCGNFTVKYLSSATSDYTEVGFPENVKELHNEIRKSEGGEGKWQTNGFVRNLSISNISTDSFRSILKAIAEAEVTQKNKREFEEEVDDSFSDNSIEDESVKQKENEYSDDSDKRTIEDNNASVNSSSEESEREQQETTRQYTEAQRIIEKNKAYAEAASIAAEGLSTGISEGIITGLSLGINLRSAESETPLGAIPTVLQNNTYELGIQMGKNANSGFSVGYGPGGDEIIYDTSDSSTYVVGLHIGILNLLEFQNSYGLQLSVGGEYGTGSGDYTDSNYNGDDTWDITDDVSFYGGNINAKFMKFFMGGYGYGFAKGSTTRDGETIEYDTFYSKVTLGVRIPF